VQIWSLSVNPTPGRALSRQVAAFPLSQVLSPTPAPIHTFALFILTVILLSILFSFTGLATSKFNRGPFYLDLIVKVLDGITS